MLLAVAAVAIFLVILYVLYCCYRTPNVMKPPIRAVSVGEGTTRRNAETAKGLVGTYKGKSTVWELFFDSCETYGSMDAVGFRETVKEEEVIEKVEVDGKIKERKSSIPWKTDYQWMSFDDLAMKVKMFGAGLVKLGLKPKTKLSIFASTRWEWQASAQACWYYNFPVVTLYPSLGPDALVYGFNQTKVSHIITEKELLPVLLQALSKCKAVKAVIYMGTLTDEEEQEYAKKFGKIELYSWDEVCEKGEKMTAPKQPSKPDDVAVIMYTSGSTGNPKGVVVTQKNMVACVAGLGTAMDLYIEGSIQAGTHYIAYLPLAHILEMAAELLFMIFGAKVGYSNPRTLVQVKDEQGNMKGDIQALKPHYLAAVPAVLEKLRGGIEKKVNASKIAKILFNLCYKAKLNSYLEGKKSPIADKIIFNKIKANFGGNLKFIVSGGAPLSEDTQQFMNVCLGTPVMQGYGLTETCAAGTICHPDERMYGNVGPPLPSCEIKLVDVSDMNYTSKDTPYPRGEICIRGPNVTTGYYEEPEKTKEVFVACEDGEGEWFYTGDIGMFNEFGHLSIIDRKKDLIKLVQGEYVALGKLESIYSACLLIERICVWANAHQRSPVAVVVPERAAVRKYFESQGRGGEDVVELLSDPSLKSEILASITAEGKRNKLARFEMVSNILITADEWTPQNAMLTEALKLKRYNINQRYEEELNGLY